MNRRRPRILPRIIITHLFMPQSRRQRGPLNNNKILGRTTRIISHRRGKAVRYTRRLLPRGRNNTRLTTSRLIPSNNKINVSARLRNRNNTGPLRGTVHVTRRINPRLLRISHHDNMTRLLNLLRGTRRRQTFTGLKQNFSTRRTTKLNSFLGNRLFSKQSHGMRQQHRQREPTKMTMNLNSERKLDRFLNNSLNIKTVSPLGITFLRVRIRNTRSLLRATLIGTQFNHPRPSGNKKQRTNGTTRFFNTMKNTIILLNFRLNSHATRTL